MKAPSALLDTRVKEARRRHSQSWWRSRLRVGSLLCGQSEASDCMIREMEEYEFGCSSAIWRQSRAVPILTCVTQFIRLQEEMRLSLAQSMDSMWKSRACSATPSWRRPIAAIDAHRRLVPRWRSHAGLVACNISEARESVMAGELDLLARSNLGTRVCLSNSDY